MKLRLFILVVSISIVFLVTSCSKTISEIPAYLKVDSTTVIHPNIVDQTSEIYALKISTGTNDRGSWAIPFQMPNLNLGSNNYLIVPVVKNNNLTTLFEQYPLYSPILIDMKFEAGKIKDTTFRFNYHPSVATILSDGFEQDNKFSASTITSTQARSGNKSLRLYADSSTPNLTTTAIFNRSISFPLDKKVYLEYDYYMPEGSFSPGLTYEDNQGVKKSIFFDNLQVPNKRWTHVYLMLTEAIRVNGQSSYTPIFSLTVRNGKQNAEVFIDNIRIFEKPE